MDYQFLSRTALFQGSEPEQVKEMMKCFYARERHYRKGEIVLYMGDLVKDLGLVLSGGVTIERDDLETAAFSAMPVRDRFSRKPTPVSPENRLW